MADDIKVTGSSAGVGSPEFVAYLLMCCIGREKASSMMGDYSVPVIGTKDKDWVLSTYRECLHMVRHGFTEEEGRR